MTPIRFLLILLAVTTGCMHQKAPVEAAPEARWILSIQNRHWLDVDVFVIHDGQRSRLGPVTAASVETFVLRTDMLGQLGNIRLQAGSIGARDRIESEPVVVRQGQQVEWTLEHSLGRSSIAVW